MLKHKEPSERTRFYALTDKARTAVLVKRFDRDGAQRHMVLSGASLLETEYPSGKSTATQNHSRWSYPLLAQAMRRIGVPISDLNELFGRMLFNAICGNDDDHPRNHAAIWNEEERKWRLSPAFDIVPNLTDAPKRLAMQLSNNRWDINKEALMADWRYFGFDSLVKAEYYRNQMTTQIIEASEGLEDDGVQYAQAQNLRTHMHSILKGLS